MTMTLSRFCSLLFAISLALSVGCGSGQVRTLMPSSSTKPTLISIPPHPSAAETVQPTWTSLTILSEQEKVEQIKRLLDKNAGCQLPCWWGITPGQTRWVDASSLLIPLSLRANEVQQNQPQTTDNYLYFSNPVDLTSDIEIKQTYNTVNGVVGEIRIESLKYGLFSTPKGVLTAVGIPPKIYLGGEIDPYQHFQYFEVVLYYPEEGILAIYGNREQEQKQFTLNVCFAKYTYQDMYLWPPLSSFEESRKFIFQQSPGVPFYLLQEVTDLTPEKFYHVFTTAETPCITTPAEKWPGHGY
jgi:hypothetical protein